MRLQYFNKLKPIQIHQTEELLKVFAIVGIRFSSHNMEFIESERFWNFCKNLFLYSKKGLKLFHMLL